MVVTYIIKGFGGREVWEWQGNWLLERGAEY